MEKRRAPKVLGIIPARGGSKELPRKNLLPLAGKPLIAWTIEAALSSQLLDRVILSSDSAEIIEVARSYGCEVPFIRPKNLAEDSSCISGATLHVLDNIQEDYDYFVLLQPTSPLRTFEDIDAGITFCLEKEANSCVSMTKVKSLPHWMYTVDGSGQIKSVMGDFHQKMRQDLPEICALNGALYICNVNHFLSTREFIVPDTLAYIMPKERSYDIDSAHDLDMCEYLLSARLKTVKFFKGPVVYNR